MNILVIMVIGLVSVSFAFEPGCGVIQRLKVKRQWAKVYGRDMSREKLAHLIWKQLVLF